MNSNTKRNFRIGKGDKFAFRVSTDISIIENELRLEAQSSGKIYVTLEVTSSLSTLASINPPRLRKLKRNVLEQQCYHWVYCFDDHSPQTNKHTTMYQQPHHVFRKERERYLALRWLQEGGMK